MSHPIHRLAAWQSAEFLVNSRLGPFTAALHSHGERPFFRSYGASLLSSLTTVFSSTLGYSPHLPVSVYGTNGKESRLEGFLGSGIRAGLWLTPPIRVSALEGRICLPLQPTRLDRLIQQAAGLSLLRHLIAQTTLRRHGNI